MCARMRIHVRAGVLGRDKGAHSAICGSRGSAKKWTRGEKSKEKDLIKYSGITATVM